jgi:hypothetical protein
VADDTVDVRLRLKDHRRFKTDARSSAKAVGDIGDAGDRTARSFDRSNRSSGRMRRGLVLLKSAAATGAIMLGGGLVFAANDAVAAFEESRQVVGQTNAVLKSTGGVANVTAAGVDRLTASLMAKTAIDDEQIRQGANMLLTFKKVRNEVGRGNKVFDQAVGLATDMAAGLGKDPRSAALQLGKALNDPVKGMTALGRAGIQFTDDQRKQIGALVESGDLLGAQKVLLREVSTQFRGSAAAQATPMKRMRVAYGELSESAGALLAPAVDKGATALAGFFDEMQTGKGAGGEFVRTVERLWTEAKPVAIWFGKAAGEVGEFVGEHPELAKVAVALIGVSAAARLIRFGGAITGVNRLFKGVGRLAKTKAGEKATTAITSQLSKLPGLAKGALGKSRDVFRNMMGSVGRSGGDAATSGIVTNTSGKLKTAAGKGGRLRVASVTAFKGMGAAAGMAFVAEYGDDVLKGIDDLLSKLPGSRTGGIEKGARHGAGSTQIPGAPGLTVEHLGKLKKLAEDNIPFLGGGRTGGYVSSTGIQAFRRGGLKLPPGEDGLAALRHGEFVMRTEAVDRYGLNTMRALNAGRVPLERANQAGGGAGIGDISDQLRQAVRDGIRDAIEPVPEGTLLGRMARRVENERARD